MKILGFALMGFCCLMATSSFAQNDYTRNPLYVTYPFNPLAVNPAYAGSREVVSMTGLFRRQSLLGQSTNSSQYFSIDLPVSNDQFGVGFQAFNDSYSQQNVGFLGSVALRSYVGEDGVISLGAQAGLIQVRGTGFSAVNEFKGTYGAGIYYRDYNKYVGVAMPSINKLSTNNQTTGGTTQTFQFPNPIFATAGYVHEVHDDLAFKFGMLVRLQSEAVQGTATTALDFHAMAWFRQKFGIGGYYQGTGSDINAKQAIILSAEYQAGYQFRFGLGFDLKGDTGFGGQQTNPLTGGVMSTGKGLYYLMLRYEFDKGDGRIENFRYF